MADIVSPEVRSRMMSGIRGKNTKPELVIRRGLHGLGFRYRLHDKNLPGKPDLVFPKYRAVIFVHGCFWHGHDCHLFKWPGTRPNFWSAKIARNREVDRAAVADLKQGGWRILTIWECALKGKERLAADEVFDFAARWIQSGEEEVSIRGNKSG